MTSHFVYRAFDAEGLLLYVGYTADVAKRLAQHRSDSAWYRELAKVKSHGFPSRKAALLAEKQAIVTEKPMYNIKHRPCPAKRIVGLQVDEDLLAEMDAQADKLGQTRTTFIVRAVTEWMKR